MSVKLQLVLGTSPESAIIARAGGGDENTGLSHADIMLKDGSLLGARSDAIGGKPPGVQVRPQGYDTWTRRVVIEIPCTEPQETNAMAFARAQIGKPYDHEAILAFVAGRDWRDPEAWFCSELAAATLEYAGIMEKLYAPTNKIMPEPLAIVATAIGGVVIERVENCVTQ